MAHPDRARLLAALPSKTAASLDKLLGAAKRSSKKTSAAFVAALREADYPFFRAIPGLKLTELTDARARGVMPLSSELTPAQRALAELLAYEDDAELYFHDGARWQVFCFPETAANRRRWLGIDPGGVLEAPMDVVIDGAARAIPTWQAVQRAAYIDGTLKAFFDKLPMARRLEVLGALFPPAYGLSFIVERPDTFMSLAELGNEGATWAPACADRLVDLATDAWRASLALRKVVFLALARGGVAIEPRWEPLFPLLGQPAERAAMRECMNAIAPARREATLVAAMRDDALFDTMGGALALLDDAPSARVAALLLEHTDSNALPAMLTSLDALAAHHPPVAEALAAYRARKTRGAIELVCGDAAKPTSADALTAVQQKQLRAFGRAYDGEDLTPRARLAAGKSVDEGSFAGFLEIVPIVDAKKRKPQYDAYLMVDSGSIFEAGTTKQVAAIVQGGLDECHDAALADALKRALATRPRG
jgi:hypothetical protein